jgi:hypothetical protein
MNESIEGGICAIAKNGEPVRKRQKATEKIGKIDRYIMTVDIVCCGGKFCHHVGGAQYYVTSGVSLTVVQETFGAMPCISSEELQPKFHCFQSNPLVSRHGNPTRVILHTAKITHLENKGM